MNLALLLQQTEDPVNLDELFGHVVRIGIIALFFFGPALKKLFGKQAQKPAPVRGRRTPVPTVARHEASSEPRRPEPKSPIELRDEAECYEEDFSDLEEGWGVPPALEALPAPVPSPIYRPEAEAAAWNEVEFATPIAPIPVRAALDKARSRSRSGNRRPDWKASRAAWRSAMILREVLGPPVALRPQDQDRAPFG